MAVEWGAKTQPEVARFFGIALNTLTSAWVANGCPLDKIDEVYDLSAIAQWKIKHEQKRRPKTEDEALLDADIGGDWKERWVRSKALIGELQLQVQHGDLVAVEDVWPRLQLMAEVIRAGLNKLEAEYGRQAADIVRTPLERMQEELEAMQVDTGVGTDD